MVLNNARLIFTHYLPNSKSKSSCRTCRTMSPKDPSCPSPSSSAFSYLLEQHGYCLLSSMRAEGRGTLLLLHREFSDLSRTSVFFETAQPMGRWIHCFSMFFTCVHPEDISNFKLETVCEQNHFLKT